MGISRPIVSEIAYRTYAINEFGMATCFLLEGTERGLLIDTGCGMYNIREIADELSTLPYDVVLTHGHGDHVAWMDQWEEVWLHPADWDMVSLERLEQNKAMISRYPAMMAAFGSFDAYDIRPEQARYPDTLPRLIPLEEGHIFDLGGGRKVEVIHTPGHTPGEVVLIDDASRILFSGDACNPNLGIRASSVNTALKGLLKVKAQGHGGQFADQELGEGDFRRENAVQHGWNLQNYAQNPRQTAASKTIELPIGAKTSIHDFQQRESIRSGYVLCSRCRTWRS